MSSFLQTNYNGFRTNSLIVFALASAREESEIMQLEDPKLTAW